MAESIREQYGRLHVGELLGQHRGLRIVPNSTRDLVLRGPLSFEVRGPGNDRITDTYDVEVRVGPRFPQGLPEVRETGGRIPRDYHKLEGDLLCLGAPTAVRLQLAKNPTLPALVNELVIPYLYGYSFFLKHGRLPYGELAHGDDGIREYLSSLFCAARSARPEEFLCLAGMKKRTANKKACPCGSGRRLGRCHNRRVNSLRRQMGRRWFQSEYERVAGMLRPPAGADSETAKRGRWRKRDSGRGACRLKA